MHPSVSQGSVRVCECKHCSTWKSLRWRVSGTTSSVMVLSFRSTLTRIYFRRSIPGAGFLRRHVEKLAAPDAVSAPPPTRPQGRGGNSRTWPQANPRQRQRRLVDLYQDQPQQQVNAWMPKSMPRIEYNMAAHTF